jgi:glycosyltransferase involved in cell wall biosynthesis
MKVLFVFGGLPHYFNKVLNKINADSNIEVSVIAPSSNGATIGSGVHQTDEGIEFKVLRLQEYKTWYGKPFFKGFYQTVKNEKPDIIVTGWPYFIAFVFMPLLTLKLKLNGVKLYGREIPFTVPYFKETLNAFSERCVDSQKIEKMFSNVWLFRFHKYLRKCLYTFVFDHALTYTEKGIDVLSSYGLSKSKITVTYNSPDTENLARSIELVKSKYPYLKANPNRLIHVGRLVKWKNVDMLIRAVYVLKDKYPEIELAILGNGEEELALKKLCADMELNDQVKFLGAIYEGEDQSVEFLKSSVYVLAGMGGLSINEAMAHSLPIICSVADGTEKHLVFEGENGFYFKDSDLESLCLSIEKMFQADRFKMGQKSLSIIEDSINIEKVSKRFVEAFLYQK